jgi:hypothetical protein
MSTRIRVDVTIFGSPLDHDEVTTALGLAPTATWRKGDLVPQTILTCELDGWQVSSGYRASLDLGALVREVITPFLARKEAIARLRETRGADIEVECVIDIGRDSESPAFTLENDLLQGLVELGAELDVDIYRSM